MKNKMKSRSSDTIIAAIDVEIEACEIAIKGAYATQEVRELERRIQELLKQRKDAVR
tara:strand:- start:330 stop:500 length:171 start_codon:yes stop_codon:yes gene_type:complete